MPSLDLPLLLETGYWFSTPGAPTPITYALIALFALLLLAGLFVWLRRRKLFPGQRVKTRLAAQLGPWFVGLATTGLLFLLLRLVEFPILSARVLWLLCLIAMLGIVAYVAWYMTRRYPAEVARLQRQEEMRRWIPKRKARRTSKRRR